MERIVIPELLDSLPVDHPDAVASRRDLRRINFVMGNFKWVARQVTSHVSGGERIVEIGAGDGGLARYICERNPKLAAQYHGLDLVPRPGRWPSAATWHQTDLWSAAAGVLLSSAGIVIANLFLHHFEDPQLQTLGERLQNCRIIIACEPCRRLRNVWLGRLLFPFVNRVTRHDMIISIRAGYRIGEVALRLGPRYADREIHGSETLTGACRSVLCAPSPMCFHDERG
jgi:hypothetical protein